MGNLLTIKPLYELFCGTEMILIVRYNDNVKRLYDSFVKPSPDDLLVYLLLVSPVNILVIILQIRYNIYNKFAIFFVTTNNAY